METKGSTRFQHLKENLSLSCYGQFTLFSPICQGRDLDTHPEGGRYVFQVLDHAGCGYPNKIFKAGFTARFRYNEVNHKMEEGPSGRTRSWPYLTQLAQNEL